MRSNPPPCKTALKSAFSGPWAGVGLALAFIGFLAAIAKQERVRFSERIKAGQARSSKAPGRPALGEDVVAELRRLRAQGLSFKKIQLATGVPVTTMHKYLAGS
jgi:DNA invertase Pin-like site-specific DNA recombinase